MTTTRSSPLSASTPLIAARPGRLLSLDVLRGLTIAFMILVNNNGNESQAYWPLKHASWTGFTPTALVFRSHPRYPPLLYPDANPPARLDRQIFSAPHPYERTRDPARLLTPIPALVTALLGPLAGIWLRTQRTLGARGAGIATARLTG